LSQFSIQRSEVPGTGSSDPFPPTGDGAVMSHSTPLEPRTLSFCASDAPESAVQAASLPPLDHSTTDPGEGEHLSPPEPVGRSHLGAQGAKPPHYPDYVAQSYNSGHVGDELGLQAHFLAPTAGQVPADPDGEIPEISRGRGDPRGMQLELSCPSWAILGECDEGHHYAKELICAREWCRSCGGHQGKAHQRRKAAWLPRASQLRMMGYFVITIPPELRERFRSLEALRAFGKAIKRVMKRHGFSRGLRRWHWFGEDHPGHGLQGDGMPVYHPHLNLLVEAGWLPASKLEAIRRSVAKVLQVGLGRVNVHYTYGSSVAEKLHMVKYVLRPTFEHWEWDPEMAHRVIGFRHMLPWGTWKDDPAWSIPESDADALAVGPLEQGRCPVDGTPVKWREVVAANLVVAPWWAELGGGYRSWTGLARDGPGSAGDGAHVF